MHRTNAVCHPTISHMISQTHKIHHIQRDHHTMSSFNGAYANELNDRVKRCAINLLVEDLVIQKKAHKWNFVPQSSGQSYYGISRPESKNEQKHFM